MLLSRFRLSECWSIISADNILILTGAPRRPKMWVQRVKLRGTNLFLEKKSARGSSVIAHTASPSTAPPRSSRLVGGRCAGGGHTRESQSGGREEGGSENVGFGGKKESEDWPQLRPNFLGLGGGVGSRKSMIGADTGLRRKC